MHAYLLTSLRNLVVLLDRLDQPALAARLIGAIDGEARLPSFGTERAHLLEVEDRTRNLLGSHLYGQLYDQARAAPFDDVTTDVIDELRQLAT
jgi:hypothetical protein